MTTFYNDSYEFGRGMAGGALDCGRLQLVDGVRQVEHLSVELVDEGLQLVHGIQHLDAPRVRVEAHLEGSRHVGHPAPELVLGVLEALRDEVDGLVFLVLVGLDGGQGRLEGPQLRLVAEGVQKLPVGAEQPGAVGFHGAVLFAKTELHCEPVDLQVHQWNIEDDIAWKIFNILHTRYKKRIERYLAKNLLVFQWKSISSTVIVTPFGNLEYLIVFMANLK